MQLPDSYRFIAARTVAEERIKGSRFIAVAMPCASMDDVKPAITALMSEYPDATHYCYAAVCGPTSETRSSDAGEPSGTAGKPILDVLLGEGVTDSMCVVIRYFGGTLLGTGGLVRAYSGTAHDAVSAAPRGEKVRCATYSAEMDYSTFSGFERLMMQYARGQPEKEFTDRVMAKFRIEVGRCAEFEGKLSGKNWLQYIANEGESYFRG